MPPLTYITYAVYDIYAEILRIPYTFDRSRKKYRERARVKEGKGGTYMHTNNVLMYEMLALHDVYLLECMEHYSGTSGKYAMHKHYDAV